MVVRDHVHAPCRGRAHGGGRAGHAAVVGVEVDIVQARVVRRLDQQREVGAPVAGDHRVGARLLDLGDVGREIAHLGQRVQVVAHDLHVGPLAGQVLLGVLGDLLAVRVVLVDEIDLLDGGLVLHEGGHGLHLHRRVGVEAEVPVAALAVGEVRIDRGVVEVEHLLAGIARIVLFQRVDDGERGSGAVALHHVARALVHRGAQRAGGFLGAELVVDADDLELHARGVLLAEFLCEELEALELVGAHRGHQARKWIEPGDLDGFALLGKGTACGRQHCRYSHQFDSKSHRLSPCVLGSPNTPQRTGELRGGVQGFTLASIPDATRGGGAPPAPRAAPAALRARAGGSPATGRAASP